MESVRRALAVLTATAVGLGALVGLAQPAGAGTLTNVNWSVSKPHPGATGVRYTYSGTTATTNNVTSFAATVPSGTKGSGAPYLDLPGSCNNRAWTADSAQISITGDLDLRAAVKLEDWTPSSAPEPITKRDDDRSYALEVAADGRLSIKFSTNGTSYSAVYSTVATGAADGSLLAIRSTLDVNDGSGNRVSRFYTKSTTESTAASDTTSNSGWTQLGATVTTAGTVTIFDSASPLYTSGTSCGSPPRFKTYYLEVRNGIDGSVVAAMNPYDSVPLSATWTSSLTGETWELYRVGGDPLKADIVYDITPVDIAGFASAGQASLRSISGEVQYHFTPGSVASGSPFLLSFDGFVNTISPGSYTSTLRTRNGNNNVDSATTSSVVFDNNTTLMTTVIARTITFTNNTDTITMLMDPSLAALSDRTNTTTSLAIATNASSGYTLAGRATALTGSGQTLAAVTVGAATGVSSGSFTTNRWGFAIPSVTNGGTALTRAGALASAEYVGHTTSDQTIATQTGPTNGDTVPISTRAKIDYLQPATTYSSTITYTATPNYS